MFFSKNTEIFKKFVAEKICKKWIFFSKKIWEFSVFSSNFWRTWTHEIIDHLNYSGISERFEAEKNWKKKQEFSVADQLLKN